jgi:hypothetical protein
MDGKPPGRINRTPEPDWGAFAERRLRALLDYPSARTWAAARDIPVRPGLTLFVAVADVEPRLLADPENFVPDALTIARALRRVREGAPPPLAR